MSTTMTVQLANAYDLVFDIYQDEISQLWLDRMAQRHAWPMDDARRFYGFDNLETQRQDAESRLLQDIDTINQYQHIIHRAWTSIDDQDLLNYLHHVFEEYHGLLDQQNTEWWHTAPKSVQQALAQLNIDIHRAESVTRNPQPRFVCTWFGQPKTHQFTLEQIKKHGRLHTEWGGVYINYVEIGKTLENLFHDNDTYIGADAFKPFRHYSSDFVVRFFDQTPNIDGITKYYFQHEDFFRSHGIDSPGHEFALPYVFKVGQLRNTDRNLTINAIRPRQHITNIGIHETS
jgi:hypothetical protein